VRYRSRESHQGRRSGATDHPEEYPLTWRVSKFLAKRLGETGRFFMSAVLHALSGAAVTLRSRICLCFEVQSCVPNLLKAAMALEDQLTLTPASKSARLIPAACPRLNPQMWGIFRAAST
jgi:hypothetical protein